MELALIINDEFGGKRAEIGLISIAACFFPRKASHTGHPRTLFSLGPASVCWHEQHRPRQVTDCVKASGVCTGCSCLRFRQCVSEDVVWGAVIIRYFGKGVFRKASGVALKR